MGDETASKLSLKLLIDTRASKVLFAEADKDFVDFLFHIMLLPIGTVIKLLKVQDDKIGCLGGLYKSIETLSPNYMQPNVIKDALLKPFCSSAGAPPSFLLLHDAVASTQPGTRKFYTCNRASSHSPTYVSDSPGAVCPTCGSEMSRENNYVAPKGSSNSSSSGYVKGFVTYMVMDNLDVKPMSTISSLALMNKFHVKDIASLMEKHVQVGFSEAIRILKASLENQDVLTTVFLENHCLP